MHNPVCSGLRLWRSKHAGLLKFKDGKALFCSKKVGSQGEADGLEVVFLGSKSHEEERGTRQAGRKSCVRCATGVTVESSEVCISQKPP